MGKVSATQIHSRASTWLRVSGTLPPLHESACSGISITHQGCNEVAHPQLEGVNLWQTPTQNLRRYSASVASLLLSGHVPIRKGPAFSIVYSFNAATGQKKPRSTLTASITTICCTSPGLQSVLNSGSLTNSQFNHYLSQRAAFGQSFLLSSICQYPTSFFSIAISLRLCRLLPLDETQAYC